MDHISIASKTQADVHVSDKIDEFFSHFHIPTVLHRCGVRKRHGYTVRSWIKPIFSLPFLGKNFFRGIVINDDIIFGKDAAYDVLKGPRSNWRRVLLTIGVRLYRFFDRLTGDDRESVLIIDDSTYDRSRSKMVELLSRVKDHTTGRFIRGFRMLTLCWSDGVSCLPLDFALLSSTDAAKRFCEGTKIVDKRCCAFERRKEATIKSTEHLADMVKRVLAAGIDARYILMDSWFAMPKTIVTVSQHRPVICMVKKTPNVLYGYEDRRCDLMSLYRCLKKRRGRHGFSPALSSRSQMNAGPRRFLSVTAARKTGLRCCPPISTFLTKMWFESLAVEGIRKIGSYCEKTVQSFFDMMTEAALSVRQSVKEQNHS